MTIPDPQRPSVWTALGRGLALRCPQCGRSATFSGLFHAHKTCSACGVLFERQDGESVGGMYINLGIAELIALGGFFLVHGLFRPPVVPHVLFWVVFNVIFCVVFYRHSRSLWMAISYVTGGVYRGADRWTADAILERAAITPSAPTSTPPLAGAPGGDDMPPPSPDHTAR